MGEQGGRSRAALPVYHLAPATPDQRSAWRRSFQRAGCGLWLASLDRDTAPSSLSLRGYGSRCLLPAGEPGRPDGVLRWFCCPCCGTFGRRFRSSSSEVSSCVVRWSSCRVGVLSFRLLGCGRVRSMSVVPLPLALPSPWLVSGGRTRWCGIGPGLRAEVRAGLVGRNGSAWSALLAIAGLVRAGLVVHLVCWCAPLACHGEVVAAAVSWLLSSGRV
jgi:hypothetical protein